MFEVLPNVNLFYRFGPASRNIQVFHSNLKIPSLKGLKGPGLKVHHCHEAAQQKIRASVCFYSIIID